MPLRIVGRPSTDRPGATNLASHGGSVGASSSLRLGCLQKFGFVSLALGLCFIVYMQVWLGGIRPDRNRDGFRGRCKLYPVRAAWQALGGSSCAYCTAPSHAALATD